jgi:PAS domain S-box-containing protein
MTGNPVQEDQKLGKQTRPQDSRPTIGLLLTRIEDSYQTLVWSGVADVARERDANLIIFVGGALASPAEFEACRNTIYDLVGPENLDGLIFMSGSLGQFTSTEAVRDFCGGYCPLPVVSVALELEGIPSILVDNYQGIHDAVTHLIEVHGYRRIACVRGPEGHLEAEERYRAYADALAEHDIPLDPELVAPGDFTEASGAMAIQLLLDEREADFDAMVAMNDRMAIGILKVLQARGIRVSDDMVVVGFDDIAEARFTMPPLTTIRQPLYEQGRRAAETMLALLGDEEAPGNVILPTQLMVRQSCGCLSQAVRQAWVGEAVPTGEALKEAFTRQREHILAEMTQAVRETSRVSLDTCRVEKLQDAFVAGLEDGPTDAFLAELDAILIQVMLEGGDVAQWHDFLSVLRRHALPFLTQDRLLSRAENLWQQARILIGEAMHRAQAYRNLQAEQRALVLDQISGALTTTFDIAQLMDVTAQQLPRLDIASCYLSLYENPGAPAEWVYLILAYEEEKRTELGANGRRFPSRQLAPKDVFPPRRRYTMVVESLYSGEDQLGFVMFEMGPREGMVYETLRGQISSAIKGALILQEREQAEEALAQVNKDLQAEITERGRAEETLQQQEAVLGTMALAAERFLRPSDWEQDMQAVLAQLGKAANVSRAIIWMTSTDDDDRVLISGEYEWIAPTAELTPLVGIQNIPAFRKWRELLPRGEVVTGHVRNLSAEEQGFFVSRGIKSVLAVPIFVNEAWWGFMGFDQGGTEREWTEAEIDMLKTAANILGGALERRRMEETLTGERNLLRTLIDHLPDYIYVKDAQGRFVMGNMAVVRQMRLTSPAELVGKSDFDLFPEELATQYYAAEQEIIRSGQGLYNHEGPTVDASKAEENRWISTTKVPFRDAQGRIVGCVGLGRDITEHKQAERALERRALQLQTAAEVSHAASSILDLEELGQQVVGLARERFDLYYAGLFLVDDSGKWAVLQAGTGEAGQRMLEQGHRLEIGGESMIGWCVDNRQARVALDVGEEAVRFENPFLPETRSELALPLVSRGEAIGALTIQSTQEAAFSDEDIAVLRTMADQLANAIANARLYDALGREQYLMNALMDSIPAHIYFKDTASRFIRTSRSIAAQFGLDDPSQAIGKTDFDFFTEEHARPAYDDEQEIIRTGQPILGIEEKETWPDRPDTWVLTSKMPLRDQEGKIVGTFGISSDITARKQAEEALRRRAVQLQAAAEVTREATSILDVRRLLDRTVGLISDRFGFYHAGIFLVDEQGQYAVLRAASSEGGHRMLERGHRLRVGEVGIVGHVAAAGEPRITLDVGKDAIYFDNPDLPRTRSEMALPLRVRGRVIGVLDVQSTEAEAFTDEDVAILQTMADQVALSIENARLLEESQRSLRELQIAHGEYIRTAWESLETLPAFEYDQVEVSPAGPEPYPALEEKLSAGKVVTMIEPKDGRSALAAPLRLRDQVIGTITLEEMDEARPWTDDEIQLVEEVSTQVALALESARLFEETQSALDETEEQAHRLALLNEMSDQLGRAANLDDILDIAATMTGQIFVADQVSVALLTDAGDNFEIFAFHGAKGTTPAGTLLQAEGSVMEIAVRERRLIIERDDRRSVLGDVRSFMVAPLYSGVRAIGTVNVASKQPNTYDQRAGNLLLQIASLLSSAIENRRLFEETRIRAEELVVLNELAQTLTAQLNVAQVLDAAYGGASRLVDTTNFFVALYDPDKDEISFPLVEDSERLDWSPIKGGEGLTGQVIETKKPLLLPMGVIGLQESGQEPLYDAIGKPALSWLGVPLMIGDQMLGVMAVQSYTTPGLYDERDQSLLTAVASQTAIALQNARLFEETRTRAEELAVLNELAQALTAQLNVEQVLAEAYRGASRLLDTTNFYIGLYDPERNELRFVIDVIESVINEQIPVISANQGLAGYIVRSRTALLLEDHVREQQEALGIEMVGEESLSWVGVPLLVGARVLGVMAAQSFTTPRFYNEHHRDLLTAIASQTAIALQNARLFEETRIRAEELAVLNELAQALTAQLNVEQVLDEAYRGASHLLDTTNFYIALYNSDEDEITFALTGTEGEVDRTYSTRRGAQGITEHIIRTRQPLLMKENVAERLVELGIEQIGTLAFSWLGVPLMVGDQVMGVMAVQSYTTPSLYDEHDQDLLTAIANQTAIALQNAYLFGETQAALTETETLAGELAVLNELAQALTAQLNVDQVIEEAFRGTSRLLDATNFAIGLYEPEQDEIVFPFFTTESEIDKQITAIPASKGLNGYVVRNRTSLFVPENLREWHEERGMETVGELARCWLGVPMVLGGQVLGVISVQSYTTPRLYDEHDRDLLSAIASQTAIALQNARLFEETQSRLAQLAALGETASAVASTLELDKLLNLITQQATTLLQGDGGIMNLVDWENEEDEVVTAIGSQATALGVRNPLQDALSGWVSLHNEPVISNRLQSDDRVDLRFRSGELLGQSAIIAPLTIKDQVVGTLAIIDKQGGEGDFDQADLELLTAFANQAATAIENARLFEDARNRAERLAVVNRITSATSATLNLDDLMEAMHQELVPTFQSDALFIALYDAEVNELDFRIIMDEGVRGSPERRPLGGFSAFVVSERKPLLIRDYDREQDRLPTPVMVGEGIKLYPSWLGVPMLMSGEVIGVIGVMSNRPYAYDKEDELLLLTIADQITVAMQNIRLFEEARIRAEELAVLNDLSQALTARLDVGQVVEETYRGASRLLDTTSFYIAFYDPDAESVSFPLAVEDGQQVQWQPRQGGKGLTEYVIRARQPLLIQENVTERLEKLGVEMIGTVALSWLGVPVLLGDRLWGVVTAQSYVTPRLYDEHARDLLSAIANQMAIALQNASLFEETQRRATQLAAAAEVARDATAILDVEQLLDATVRLISDRFGFYHAGVFLLDEWNEYAVLQAASSEGGRRMLERGHRLKVGEVGMVGYVTATGEPRIALDVGADAVFFDNPDLPETRSAMTLPLKVRDRVIGALDVQSSEEAAFSEEDVAVLQTMADQLATAIENAHLFEGAQTDARRRALINEVLQAAATSLDPEELLHRAGEVVSQRLEVPSALFTWDARREVLSPVAVHAADATDVPLPESLQQVTYEMNPVLLEAVSGHRTCILEMTANVSGPLADVARQAQAQSVIYVPLISRGQILGVVGLGKFEEQPLVDVEFAELVAGNLSVALENAHLFQEAVRTSERLAEVDRVKTQFLANMSHELRTPLNSIIGFSRVVLKGIDGPLTEQQREDLSAIHNSGQHLLGLINDMLDISRIEAGKIELSFEKVDLREIISGVMSTAIALVKDKPVELQQSIPDDLPLVTADARRVRQILLNLVANAAKFTDAGFVHVEAEVGTDEMIISVTDSGPGIPQRDLEIIFEPFTQADASPSRKYGGTGLGLTISTSLVELHGGRIWVESEVGVGSTFFFTLPINGPPSLQEKQELPADEISSLSPEVVEEGGSRLILCVDDDEGVIMLFRRYLYKQGYRVAGLTEATRVLEEAKRLRPHAITLDVMMPQKDGWQVIQELKADPETRDIPVIMCTIIGDKDHGMSLGAADYLVKPIIEQDLLMALDRLDREAGRHRVLVVDDQPEDRELLRRMIESQEGYEVIAAASGQEAISIVRQIRPHIIILDLLMPEVDGFAVLEAVKADESTRSIPIIVVTAKDLTAEDRQLLNHRTEALIQKGVLEQEELLEDVIAALQRLDRAPLPERSGDGH